MKRKYIVLLLSILLAFGSCSFTTKKFSNPDKDKLLIQVITFVLQQGHFNPKAFDDNFSENLYDNYLEVLDPVKRYFYESDIQDFEKYKYTIDDQLKATDITFFNVVHERMIKRFEEVKEIYKEVLSEPFDYSTDENFDTDYEHTSYVKNRKEMKERWRQQLKFSTLSNYDDLYNQEKRTKRKRSFLCNENRGTN